LEDIHAVGYVSYSAFKAVMLYQRNPDLRMIEKLIIINI